MDAALAVPRATASIDEVYRAHYPRLWRSLLAFTGDAVIAEDAVAEAFAQAIRRGPALRDPEGWVWRTAYRVAAGSLKERRRIANVVVEPWYELDQISSMLIEALVNYPRVSGRPSSSITTRTYPSATWPRSWARRAPQSRCR